MGDAARHLIESFAALSETDKHEVLALLLRHAAELPYGSPTDEELTQAADLAFKELDRREASA